MESISNPLLHKPVKLLPAEVARKIAAGEVIDRPCAIVRELMDNAVDSGADSILVEIESGGIDKIRVVDNGGGMTKEDLENSAKPHATSKITSEEDLLSLRTLGFRGEALASIAAVSRLEIISAFGDEAWKLEASVSKPNIITPANLLQGTIVQSESLFENFPARRVFLKRPASESNLCRQTFIEKAIPRPDISFRLNIDGKPRLDLPKGQDLAERFVTALDIPESSALFYELHGSSGKDKSGKEDWHFSLVIGEPSVFRNDRKLIFIYVNGRRITEYTLMQAIEYGCQGYFPNGVHPVAALFLEINPALVDFNIHPAKREARFKDIGPIHHGVSTCVRNFYRNSTVSKLASQVVSSSQGELIPQGNYGLNSSLTQEKNYRDEKKSDSIFYESSKNYYPKNSSSNNFHPDSSYDIDSPSVITKNESIIHNDLRNKFFSDSYIQKDREQDGNNYLNDSLSNIESIKIPSGASIIQIPSALDSSEESVAVGKSSNLNNFQQNSSDFRYVGSVLGVFLLAEKAGCLYLVDQHAAHERILYNKFIQGVSAKQPLLVPYVIETQSQNEDEYLKSILQELNDAGFEVKECGQGRWEFCTVPSLWNGSEKDLEKDLLTKRIPPKEVLSSLAATNACRAAIKDGDIIDSKTATELIKETFNLSDPHCPHGRPLWTVISKEQLFQAVRRT